MMWNSRQCASLLGRYAARCVNFVLIVTRVAAPGARSAPKETGDQPRGLTGIPRRAAPWLITGIALIVVSQAAAQGSAALPRTADGRPDLQGIWQVRNRATYDLEDHAARHGMPAGRSVIDGGVVPYQPWAAARKRDNFAKRATADPLAECYMAGVPRIMYMEFPFQIFQTRDAVAMLFEWQQIYRLIYTNGSQS